MLSNHKYLYSKIWKKSKMLIVFFVFFRFWFFDFEYFSMTCQRIESQISMFMFCNEISNKSRKMIFFLSFFCIINYSLHAHLKIAKKNTRVRHLNKRVIFACFIVLIIFYRLTIVAIQINFSIRFIFFAISSICSTHQSFIWHRY